MFSSPFSFCAFAFTQPLLPPLFRYIDSLTTYQESSSCILKLMVMAPLLIYLPVSACSIYALAYLARSVLARSAAGHHARSCRLEWLEESQYSIAAGAAASRFGPGPCSSKFPGGAATASSVHVIEATDLRCNVNVDADDVPRPELVECVFCLSNVEDGEESRELGCRHVFHRGCLDRWLVVHARATCPLCRSAVVPVDEARASSEAAEAAKNEGDVDDGEVDDWRVILAAAFVGGNGWVASCVTLVNNVYSSCKMTTGMLT